MSQNKEIICIDETGINCQLVPLYIYARKGKKVCLSIPPKGTNISIIAATGVKGLYGFQVIQGGLSGGDFACFIVNLINNYPQIKLNLDIFVFFMDNASVHKAELFQNLRQHINILYNAPYSPFLNYIKEVFALWKYHVRLLNYKNNKNILQNILIAATKISADHFKAFYYHAILQVH